MNKSKVKTTVIPNQMCERAGVSGRFLSANEFAVFPSQFVRPTSKDAPSAYSTNTEAKIYHIRPNIILFHPILRRLVNEASGIFVQVQKAQETIQIKDELLVYSVQYRSVIRGCLENLQEELNRTTGDTKQKLQSYVTIFYSIEFIWHLCEILYLHTNLTHMLGTKLLEWVRFHIPKYEQAASDMLTNEKCYGVESEDNYWPTVIGCLLQGRFEEVCLLLAMHSNSKTSPFRAAESSLQSMPTYASFREGVSLTEFSMRRKHWIIETQAKLDSQVFHAEPNLEFIMRLLVGEELAWNEAKKYCEAWYEYMAGWLFITEPTLKTYELARYSKKCVERFGSFPPKHIDLILLAAMKTDVEFLTQIQSMNESGWFITHLVDLLYNARQLDAWKIEQTTPAQLRESFILEYGTLLMGHKSLWQIGLCYLDHCPVQGTAAIELLLPRISHDTEAKANIIIREATKRKLFLIANSIKRIVCHRNMQCKRWGNAVVWAMRASDQQQISYIIRRLLEEVKVSYELPCEDLLGNLGGCMLTNDNLIFIGKYYEFRRHMENKNYAQAVQDLVGLIGSGYTPKFFWDVLLTESVYLLERADVRIDANSCLVIMNCLEERAGEKGLQDKVTMIRMAVARNTAGVLSESRAVES